ncbi:Calpain family cysteine protease [Leishmania braziliensis]|nr:Calpain family cysteine protease [Leishmania braziliensis]
MPAKASSAPPRAALAGVCSTFVDSRFCSLPLWDDAQVAQEKWGDPLTVSVPSVGGDGGREVKEGGGRSKAFNGSKQGSTSFGAETHFKDEATHHAVEAFIVSLCPPRQSDRDAESVCDVSSSDEVTWLRPTEVFRPFRPVVHHNVTPFMNPYATAEALIPVNAKTEEVQCQSPSSAGAVAPNNNTSHRRGGGNARQSSAAAPVQQAFYQLYPEAITVLDMFPQEERELWTHCTPAESVRRYRALPPLMQPYDGVLIAGCAETPAQACESRYSTALRHKLQQAEQLASLAKTPPFLMSAFNSALMAVEQAQRYIPAGWYLWELVYPHAPGTCHPVYNPFGKYAVKLFVDGAYRKVLVDDCLPVDVLGRPLLSITSRKELWPCLIAKAVVKALGPVSGVQALTSAPELIVAALLGNWVPQYLSPRHDIVYTTALLLLYQRQLTQLESLTEPFVKDAVASTEGRGRADSAGDVTAKGGKDNARGRRGSPNPTLQRRISSSGARTSSVKRQQSSRACGVSGDAGEEAGELKPLTATEYCEPIIDEPLPEQPFYVCGLHAPSAETLKSKTASTASGGYGFGTQLYTIHAMKSFRNTVALLLHTTPRACISEGIFEKEKDADDVSALHDWGRRAVRVGGTHAASTGKPSHGPEGVATPYIVGAQGDVTPSITDMMIMDSDRAASVTSCWLTLEEFMLHMETVIIWRQLTGRYANAVSVSGERLLQHQGNGSATGGAGSSDSPLSTALRKKSPTPRRGEVSPTATATSSIATQSSTPPPPSMMWWKLTAEKAVEAVVVVSCSAVMEAAARGTVAAKIPPTTLSSSHLWLSTGPSDPVAGLRGSAGAAEGHLERRVHFHHFQWDRAEPLNHIGSLTYTNGVLRSTVLHFRPGVHLLRVDLHQVQAPDTISFLSDASMEVQLDLSHDANRDGFVCLTDAGVYSAVQSCDIENVWLKRVFSLNVPTCVTLQLSTLDSTEDVMGHRQIYTTANQASAAIAAGKGGGNHGKTAASVRGAPQGGNAGAGVGRSGSTPPVPSFTAADGKKRSEGLLTADAENRAAFIVATRDASMSILRYTSLLLLNLDRPEDYCVGTAGRLVKLKLEPNEKGYLIIAYTKVPGSLMQSVQPQDKVAGEVGGMGSLLPMLTPTASPTEEELRTPESPLPRNSLPTPASTTPPLLFPAAQWKLTLRSSAELQSFDAVAHDLNNVTVEADLPRGGSPILCRRILTITEATHVSIVAQLRSPFPMPYTVRIVRLLTPAAGVPTSTTPKAIRASCSNNAPVGMSEPVAADLSRVAGTAPSQASAFVVYESPLTLHRLFVADVLLSTAVDTSVGKGGKGPVVSGAVGGAAAVYAIEAAVSEEDAAAWNESCRQSQEDAFLLYRKAAEEQAAISNERDLAEYHSNPDAFVQRKREAAAQRRQCATEAAEKAVSRSATTGRRRSGSMRRQSHHMPGVLESFAKNAHRGRSSSMRPDTAHEASVQHYLDTVDPNWAVHINIHLSFSSSRAEPKVDTPAPDALAELRRHMKETVSWLQEWSEPGASSVEAAAAASVMSPIATATPSGSRSGASRSQRDVAAATVTTVEDALRAEAARQSRLEYLGNPQHLFAVFLDPGDNADAAGTPAGVSAASFAHKSKHDTCVNSNGTGAAHSAVSSGTQGARCYRKEWMEANAGASSSVSDYPSSAHSPPVLMYDGPATQFRYAAPLQPAQYRIELLPLRSWEESPRAVSQGQDGVAGAGAAAAATSNRGRRPKASSSVPPAPAPPARAHGSGSGVTSGSSPRSFPDVTSGGFSTSIASALSCPLTAAECEAMLLPLRRPLTEASGSWDLALAPARVAKSENQARLKGSFHAYFEAMAEQKAANGDASGVALPLVYHSLLGGKEEDLGASFKLRRSIAFT